jgi:outer membrane protein OmpA-like peptidoglycan-associated protein
VAVLVFGAVLIAGCGGGKGSGGNAGAPTTVANKTTTTGGESTTSATGAEEPSTTLPPGAQPGLFDFNQDGTNEPTCGTADYQAGLVIRTYCDDLSAYANTPESDATLVQGALFGQPTPPDDPRDTAITGGASVAPIHLQGADGKELVVYTMSSDTVFAVGSDELQDPARESLSVIAAGIQQSYPGATVQVRGHTDSTGGAAANQSLSERRAAAVADFFVSQGFDPAKVTSVGLGQTVPNYVEDTATGRDQNRRIELLVRPV